MTLLRIAFILSLLGSPALSGDQHPHTKAIAVCKEAMRSGYFQLRVEFAVCVNLANAREWGSKPHWDLMEYAAARELLAAKRFDQGLIDEAEYSAARAQIKSELFTAYQQRQATASVSQPRRRSIKCYEVNDVTTCH
jgi:hypothetical protein